LDVSGIREEGTDYFPFPQGLSNSAIPRGWCSPHTHSSSQIWCGPLQTGGEFLSLSCFYFLWKLFEMNLPTGWRLDFYSSLHIF
jgi:uncharacterized protein YbdZ (MbtH family)